MIPNAVFPMLGAAFFLTFGAFAAINMWRSNDQESAVVFGGVSTFCAVLLFLGALNTP